MRMSELIRAFEEMIDEEGEVKIANVSFYRSQILKELDPIAYKCSLYDYADAMGIDVDELENDIDIEEYLKLK